MSESKCDERESAKGPSMTDHFEKLERCIDSLRDHALKMGAIASDMLARAEAAEARCARLANAIRLAATRIEICADRMRGCNAVGGDHQLLEEVVEWAAEARAALSDSAHEGE